MEKTIGGAPYRVVNHSGQKIVICSGRRLPLSKLQHIAKHKPPFSMIGDVDVSFRGETIILGCLEEPFNSFKRKVSKESRD